MRPPKSYADILKYVEEIADPEERARACYEYNLSPDDDRTRRVLQSCLSGPGFYQQLLAFRLNPPPRPPKKWKPRRRKVWRPPNRLPSLFPAPVPTASAGAARMPSEVPDPTAGSHGVVQPVSSKAAWADGVASATLKHDLSDMVVRTTSVDEMVAWLDLVQSLAPEQASELAEIYAALPTSLPIIPTEAPNLFRDFGIPLLPTEEAAAKEVPLLGGKSRRRRGKVAKQVHVSLFAKESGNE